MLVQAAISTTKNATSPVDIRQMFVVCRIESRASVATLNWFTAMIASMTGGRINNTFRRIDCRYATDATAKARVRLKFKTSLNPNAPARTKMIASSMS